MSTLFISHSSRDGAAATALKARLEAQGHRSLFLDLDPEKGIQAGVSWERTLYTKLRACRAVVAVCSDHYLASQWCFAEIALARMEGKEIFVLQVDPWGPATKLPSILTEEQYIDLRTAPDAGYERLWRGFAVKGIVPEEHREWRPDDPPYPGLRAFAETDAPIFFGRDREVGEGVELLTSLRRVGHPRLLMVLGSSGSGKSSLAAAGIVPRLRRDRERWRVVGPFRPGREPIRELAAALERSFAAAGRRLGWEEILRRLDPTADDAPPPPLPPNSTAATTGAETGAGTPPARARLLAALRSLERELTADDREVAESLRRLRDLLDRTPGPPGSGPGVEPAPAPDANPLAALATELRLAGGDAEVAVVLVVDQFEELLGHDREGPGHPANRFLRLVRDGIEADDAPPLALATMRSDFLGVFQRSAPLQGVGFRSLSVGPMPRAGMREVIEGPARLGQIELEAGLTELLLDDLETADALPLLAFTLRTMWDRYRADRLLEIREYRHLGGLQGAVAQVADETFAAARELGEERDLRNAFLALARPAAEGSGWARRPASWDELDERVRPMLRLFVDQRLLVARADGTVEVAHETLFRSWATLRGWLDENAEGLRLLREIEADAAKWEKASGEDDREPYLWRGGRLARALELRQGGVLAVQGVARSFVEASERAERAKAEAEAARQRRELRRARLVAAVVGVALLVALGFWRLSVAEAEKARETARAAIARWLLADGQATLGNLVALEVRDPARTPTAVDALHDALVEPVETATLSGHTDPLHFAAFSPDGSRVVTAADDRTVRIWEASTGAAVAVLAGEARPGPAAFSPDGGRVVAAWDDGTARIVDSATGAEQIALTVPGGWIGAAVFSPDGTRVLTASEDGTARLWDAATGAAAADLRGHAGPLRAAAFSPDGRRVVTASDDGAARLWDAATGTEAAVLRGHTGPLRAATFSPDGGRVLTASDDGTARLWDAAGGAALATLAGHSGPVLDAAFSADGRRVATASEDATARTWEARSGAPIAVLRGHDRAVRTVAFSPDGAFVVTASDDRTARLWDAATGGQVAGFFGHTEEVRSAAFSADGSRIVTASDDDTARLWRPERGEELSVLRGHTDGLYDAAFGPDGRRVATAADDGTVRIWSVATGETIRVLAADDRQVRSAAFSPDGSRLATASRAGTAQIWDVATGEVLRTLRGHANWVRSAAFSADGSRVVTASDDGTARIWTAATGEPATVLKGHAGRVYAAAFSPDGSRVVTGGEDHTARIWDASSGASLLTLTGHEAAVRGAAFSPDGTRVATASEDHTARLWDAASGAEIAVLRGHLDWVSEASFSPDGSRIVTASDDDTAEVWSAEGAPLFSLQGHTSEVHAAAFSPDGSRIVTGADDGTARIWADPAEVSVYLRGRIRSRTRLCLDADAYRRTLGESTSAATAAADGCRRCVPVFFDRLGGSSPADWPAYVASWTAYQACLDR